MIRKTWHLDNRWDILWAAFCDLAIFIVEDPFKYSTLPCCNQKTRSITPATAHHKIQLCKKPLWHWAVSIHANKIPIRSAAFSKDIGMFMSWARHNEHISISASTGTFPLGWLWNILIVSTSQPYYYDYLTAMNSMNKTKVISAESALAISWIFFYFFFIWFLRKLLDFVTF